MFNWREWSGRNAELAWLRQEKKRKELCRNPAQTTHTSPQQVAQAI